MIYPALHKLFIPYQTPDESTITEGSCEAETKHLSGNMQLRYVATTETVI